MESDVRIEFDHVKKRYGDNTIIPDMSLRIMAGEFVTVIGSSGAGKTTFLKMINGLIPADEGRILVDGQDITQVDLNQLRRHIGYAIQGNVLFPHMTVEKNIAYVPTLLNKGDKKRTHDTVCRWVDLVGLDQDMLGRYPDELSGGQQQRVGIARSMAANPNLLLMDEPFGSVDDITRHQLQGELKRIHEETGTTIIFVTHDIREALDLGTRVIILGEGKIVQFDTPENIKAHPANPYVEQLLENLR